MLQLEGLMLAAGLLASLGVRSLALQQRSLEIEKC
jgi:hypothetical protein